MIALIDYGAGNLRSVEKALRFIGAPVRVAREGAGLASAAAVVLPGVGAFDDCMNALDRQGLRDPLREWIESGRPFLGICVGYQVLFERSEEFGSQARGLSVFRGSVIRFRERPGLKIPQIGWNSVEWSGSDCPLGRGIPSGSYYYFVHSYYPEPSDAALAAGRTEYGDTFASALWRDRVYATQFHPEKSQDAGLQLLRNFVEISG